MDKPLHLIRGPLLAMALLATTLGAVSVLPFGAGMDCLAAYVRTIWESERLDQDREVLSQSLKAIRSILDQVIEGQLPLPQGASALRDEIESRPEHLRQPAFEHSVHVPQAECYLHQLLDMVGNHLDGDPRREKVLKRLRKEFESVSRPPGD
jgi:hypothetical protein